MENINMADARNIYFNINMADARNIYI